MFWLKKIILQIDFISRKLIVLKYNHLTHIQNHDMNKLCFCENKKCEIMVALQPVCSSLDQVARGEAMARDKTLTCTCTGNYSASLHPNV